MFKIVYNHNKMDSQEFEVSEQRDIGFLKSLWERENCHTSRDE